MKEFYVAADLSRAPSGKELAEIGVPNAMVHAGRIKAIILAESGAEALRLGQQCIEGCLKKEYKAYNYGWLPTDFVQQSGDKAIYDKYYTATWLAYYRAAAGMTQQQLAEKSGVYIRQIQRVESGESQAGNMSAKNLLALADALSVDPRKLL